MTTGRWLAVGALSAGSFAVMVVFGPEPGGVAGATVELVRAAWELVF